MNALQKCFKAYDIRGKAPLELNQAFAAALGQALARYYRPVSAVVGYDARLSSPVLGEALTASLLAQGVNVAAAGLCGTEEIYYAAAHGGHDLGIMVTASHNPADENGFKIVLKGAAPVSRESGLSEIAAATLACLEQPKDPAEQHGALVHLSLRKDWIDWMLAYAGFGADAGQASLLRVVVNAGNGSAGPVIEELARRLPIEIIPLNFEPDGSFPKGVPNPLLPENRRETAAAIRASGADLGVAFDGDFDRCFFFDHRGEFVESCYVAGLLGSSLLARGMGEKVIHDTRVFWNTRDLVFAMGGIPVMSRGGHTYMKEAMRREDAIYGAEMSGHHFYRDFAYCDSGMLTMLLMLAMLIRSGQLLAELADAGMAAYPCSGEINFRVDDAKAAMAAVWNRYKRDAIVVDRLDGLNLEFPDWRFNLRSSNTEPLLRLNLESRGDPELIQAKLEELRQFIGGQKA
ncbi:MAG: phosphomannomutase [Desulfovibrio sp.]|nr:phosphomannomutase [Desulfovibrio sp.]